jgi:hypothetical protein
VVFTSANFLLYGNIDGTSLFFASVAIIIAVLEFGVFIIYFGKKNKNKKPPG